MNRLEEIKSAIGTIGSNLKNLETASQAEISDLVSSFSNLEGNLREYIQEITKKQILAIINKLRRNESLSEDELKYVELWVVGDAEYYTKLENNFKDWIDEFNRIINEVKKITGKESALDLEVCSRLRALSKDAVRNISDIDYFIEQRERIAKFKKSITKIGEEERETLIEILVGKLNSDSF
ncbi:hypothetical protein ACFL2Y_05255 [Candidatus Omnitrophota bacterium]